MKDIKEYLKSRRLIMDGAMGTFFSETAGSEAGIVELANLNAPEIIEGIHKSYLEAGAMLIRTNTFAAGMETLGINEETQEELIMAACRIAKAAVDKVSKNPEDRAFVAGDIGPIHENADSSEEVVLAEYIRMCDIFIAEDVDVILFETFSDLKYIRKLVKYIKSKKDIFIMANFSLNKNGFTANGISASNLLKEIAHIDEIDACGFNCGIGSGHMNSVMHKIKFPSGKKYTAR